MKIVLYFFWFCISIKLLFGLFGPFELSPISRESSFIAFFILMSSIGIINQLEKIHKCEKKILKELRSKCKDDDEDD